MDRMSAPARRRRLAIADVMRRRVVGGVAAGTLRRGDRLPSARDLAAEFAVDPRLVLAAYRVLSAEGVVEIRRRSGIYVAQMPEVPGGPPVIADGWLVDVLTQGIDHGVPAPRLGDWLRRCVTTRRLRAAVVGGTLDQIDGLCGELRDDYGVDAVPFAPEAVDRVEGPPTEMLHADFVVVATPYAEKLRAALAPHGKRVVVSGTRVETEAEWRLLLMRESVYVVVADPATESLIATAAADLRDRQHVLVLGRDDLQRIPSDGPVYVTRAAQRRLGTITVPGRHVPPTRSISATAAREILTLVVKANLGAMRPV